MANNTFLCQVNATKYVRVDKYFIKKINYANMYGIRRSLIDICLITEVKRRRARFISGWVTAWDCQVPYTLSWGSENHVNQMARLTDFELDVKEPQWT